MIRGMRVMIAGLVAVVACKSSEGPRDARVVPLAIDASNYGEDPPIDAATVDAPFIDTKDTTIRLPALDGKPADRPGVIVVAEVRGGWRLVDLSRVTVSADGVAAIPAGEPIAIPDVAHRVGPGGVLVLANADTPWTTVRDLAFALHRDCWTFAAAHAGALTATWPAKCPQDPLPAADREHPELAVWIDIDRATIGATPFPATFADGDHASLTRRLLEHRAMPRFAKRDTLTYAISDATRAGTVVQVLAAIHAAGFVNAHWVPTEWLPMRFPSGAGSDPPLPQPITPPGGLMQPGPGYVQVTTQVGDVKMVGKTNLTVEEVSRVVKARAGIYRACYQKELNRATNLKGMKGTLTVTAEIDEIGRLTSATAAGSLKNEPVKTCIQAQFMRLKFPAKSPKTRFRVPLTFSFI